MVWNNNGLCDIVRLSLRWRHSEHDGVSNLQPHDCLLNRLFRRRSKKTSQLRITGLFSRGIHQFPAQRASNAEMFPFADVIIIAISSEESKLDKPFRSWRMKMAGCHIGERSSTTTVMARRRMYLTNQLKRLRWTTFSNPLTSICIY